MPVASPSNRFMAIAKSLGAALLYAPEKASDPLENLGTLTLPDGELKNGAALQTPGLLTGGAAVSLDGEDDYVETGWGTRTNFCPNPLGEVAAKWSKGADFTVTRVADGTDGVTQEWGNWLDKHAFDGSASSNIICFRAFNAPEAGEYTLSPHIWIPSSWDGGQVYVASAGTYTGATEVKGEANMALRDQWQRVALKLTLVVGDLNGLWGLSHATGKPPSSAGTGVLYTQAVLTEKSSTLGAFFPTLAHLESGEAGWSGTAHNSQSDIGPFARRTKRTIVAAVKRDSDGGEDTLIGSSHPKGPRWKEVGSGFWIYEDGSGINNSLGDAWPIGETVVDALILDQSGGDVALHRNGELLEDDGNGGTYNLNAPPILFEDGFESGDTSKWGEVQEVGPTADVSVVESDPTPNAGTKCLRCELKSGDERAELAASSQYTEGLEVEYQLSIFLKAGFPTSSLFQLVWQLHQDGDGNEKEGDSPPIRITIVDGEWRMEGGPAPGTPFTVDWDGPAITTNAWHTFKVRVKHSQDSEVGYVELWHNGEQQTLKGGGTRVTRATIPSDSSHNYLKAGYYRDPAITETGVIGVDGVSAIQIDPGGPTLRIGAAAAAGFMDGAVLPVAVFLRELTPTEIKRLYEATLDQLSRIAGTREHVPDPLAVRIADPSTGATIARWAEDEAKAENVLANLTKSGEMSGGHKESALSLARDPRINFPDTGIYLDYFVEGAGGEDVWNGRVNQASRSDGDRMAVELKAVGHQAALQDRKALSLGFIDGDQSKWGEPSVQRRLLLIEAGIRLMAATSVGHSSADPESVLASIINDFTNVETVATDTEAGEAHYYSGGPDIGEILYAALGDIAKGEASASWESNIAVGTTDTFTTATTGTDHDASAASSQTVTAPGAGYKYARIRNRLNAASEGLALKRIFAWQSRVIGNHGLALQGTWPNVGFTSGQMLRYAIPLYTYLEATEESVEDEGYVIPQAWYSEPGDMASVVTDLTKYELQRWFVMNGKLFEVRAPGTFGRRWQASAGPSELKETGEDGLRLWDRLVVSYQDVDGRTYTVGWPGSGANTESEQLIITDPDHPAVKAGKPREDLLVLKGISTAARSLEAGERWLKEGNELSHAGEAVLRGYVMDDKAVFRPVSQVQPGDHIQFDGTGYREIVAVNYDHDSRSASVTLDAPSDALQALLERYQAALQPLGL